MHTTYVCMVLCGTTHTGSRTQGARLKLREASTYWLTILLHKTTHNIHTLLKMWSHSNSIEELMRGVKSNRSYSNSLWSIDYSHSGKDTEVVIRSHNCFVSCKQWAGRAILSDLILYRLKPDSVSLLSCIGQYALRSCDQCGHKN